MRNLTNKEAFQLVGSALILFRHSAIQKHPWLHLVRVMLSFEDGWEVNGMSCSGRLAVDENGG